MGGSGPRNLRNGSPSFFFLVTARATRPLDARNSRAGERRAAPARPPRDLAKSQSHPPPVPGRTRRGRRAAPRRARRSAPPPAAPPPRGATRRARAAARSRVAFRSGGGARAATAGRGAIARECRGFGAVRRRGGGGREAARRRLELPRVAQRGDLDVGAVAGGTAGCEDLAGARVDGVGGHQRNSSNNFLRATSVFELTASWRTI